MHLSIIKIVCFVGIGMFVSNCTNQSPVTINSSSSDNTPIATVTSQTYMASVPEGGAPSIAASVTYESTGNLEMVRRTSTYQMEHLYWYPGLSSWVKTCDFGSDITYNPAVCASKYDGNLQVVAQSSNSGQLCHYWRDGDGAWYYTGVFSSNCLGSPAMLSNRQTPINLEVIVREGNHLKHIWRNENYVWQNETQFATAQTVIWAPQFVQTTDNNFHVIAPITVGTRTYMGHWKRTYVNNQYVWNYMGYFGDGTDINWSVGCALAVNYNNNTLEAIVNVQNVWARWELFRFDGSTWSFDGYLDASTALNIGTTTSNNNEIHLTCNIIGGGSSQHWKIIQ